MGDVFVSNHRQDFEIATGFIRPKTTALFFDKLLAPKSIQETEYGHVFGMYGMPESIELTARDVGNSSAFSSMMHSITISASSATRCDQCDPSIYDEYFGDFSMWLRSDARNVAIDFCANAFRKELGINLVPIHVDKTKYEREREKIWQNGFEHDNFRAWKSKNGEYTDSEVYEITIKSIPMAIEEKLTWQQVLDFREDLAEIEKLRRFRQWANISLTNKNTSQIQDELSQQLEEYEYALKKHGVQTTISGITTILSSSLLALSALGETNLAFGCIQCCSASASIIAHMSYMMFSYKDLERMPIAYVYDVINDPEKWWGKKKI